MKVVSYGHAYVGTGWAAGGETTLHSVLSYLVKQGWDAEFVMSEPARNGVGDIVVDGVRVTSYTDVQQPLRVIPRADLVVSHLGGAQRASIIAKNSGVQSVHLLHNDHVFTASMARHANYLVYNTKWILEEFRNRRYVRPPGMVVKPPVEPSYYKTKSSRKYITCINLADGTQHYDKGPRMFYEMAERFPEQQFLGVIGAYGNQDVRKGLPNVTFMEHTGDIKKAYAQSRVILSPSKYESYGRVPIEAACSGIPSITSDTPGFREHSIGAHIVDYGDADGWEAALRDVLGHYKRYSVAAKKAANALWSESQRELEEMDHTFVQLARRKRRP